MTRVLCGVGIAVVIAGIVAFALNDSTAARIVIAVLTLLGAAASFITARALRRGEKGYR